MVQEAPQDPLVGTTLEGRFFIERLLGEGGMGRVYVAEELRLKRRCALKVLLPELSADEGCRDRFLREAQAIAQIEHENVVDIYHLGDDGGGVVFFAMELLSGEDLETRLQDKQNPPHWQQICQWMVQVAAAMSSVHAAGLIHRDLKPSNIFLSKRRDGREQVKLLDFGIVKSKDGAALTSTGAAIGTPYYMSPEQILAQELDHRTDIYSLGVLFFETVAGRMPFVGEAIQVAMQHCNVAPPTLRQVAPHLDIPDELEELIAHMLAKSPEQRVQSMDAVVQVLSDLLPIDTQSSLARPVTGRSNAAAAATAAAHLSASQEFSRQQLQRRPTATTAPELGIARTVHATPPAKPLTPASTLEIHFDHEPALPRPRPAKRSPLPIVLIGATVAALLVVVLVLFSGGKDDRKDGRKDNDAPVVAGTTGASSTPPPQDPVKPPPDPIPPTKLPEPPVATTEPPEPPELVDDPPRKGDPKGKQPRVVDPIKAIKKLAGACRKKHPGGAASLNFKYTILSSGEVQGANLEGPGPASDLSNCIVKAITATKFPPSAALAFKTITL
jgi:serine/threonine protein kinase